MGLITDLQRDVMDPECSLAQALRKAQVVGSMLRNTQLKDWAELELNGYVDKVPDYRRTPAHNVGDFVGVGVMLKNVPFPTAWLPERVSEFAAETVIAQGVRALESIVEGRESDGRIPWPPETTALVAGQIMQGHQLLSAWKVVSRSQVEQILDTVRNRLLRFVLELQEAYPEITASEEAISRIPQESAASIVNMYVIGNHNIVAGGTSVTQSVTISELKGDATGLRQYLTALGVPDDSASELEQAVLVDPVPTEPDKYGPAVGGWLKAAAAKMTDGAWKLSLGTGSALLAKAIAAYYGWS